MLLFWPQELSQILALVPRPGVVRGATYDKDFHSTLEASEQWGAEEGVPGLAMEGEEGDVEEEEGEEAEGAEVKEGADAADGAGKEGGAVQRGAEERGGRGGRGRGRGGRASQGRSQPAERVKQRGASHQLQVGPMKPAL